MSVIDSEDSLNIHWIFIQDSLNMHWIIERKVWAASSYHQLSGSTHRQSQPVQALSGTSWQFSAVQALRLSGTSQQSSHCQAVLSCPSTQTIRQKSIVDSILTGTSQLSTHSDNQTVVAAHAESPLSRMLDNVGARIRTKVSRLQVLLKN